MKKVQKRLARFWGDCGPSDTANGGRAPRERRPHDNLDGHNSGTLSNLVLSKPLPLPHELTREAYSLFLTVDSQYGQRS